MSGVFTPYTTAAKLFGTKPSWIPDELDIQRIQSYQLYEEIYWGAPDIFKVSFRGTNDDPIYVPTARTIVDAANRYTAPQFKMTLSNRTGGVDSADTIAARLAFQALMSRERFRSKFQGAKRYGIMRGDWVWHVTANEDKPQGSRLSITALDPAMYFPITDDNDVDRIVGVHLVEQITTPDGDRIHRLTYRKIVEATGITITVEEALFKVDDWHGPDAKAMTVLKTPTALPDTITAIPVYLIKNFEEPGNPFGSSEIRGFERIMAAVNQTVSDEELALALAGIGMYATTTSKPTDKAGNEIGWRLGPGAVVHHEPNSTWARVSGVSKSDLGAYGDHYDRLIKSLKEASSTPDIAIGAVDVQVASSGIALALQLGPMLAKAGEKTEVIQDVHDQMGYDILNGWFPAYEEQTFTDVVVTSVVGDAVPVDRTARLKELDNMLTAKVIDTEYYRQEATKLGYSFPDDLATRIASEQDAFAARTATELGVGSTSGQPPAGG
jgi:hypothetical protein